MRSFRTIRRGTLRGFHTSRSADRQSRLRSASVVAALIALSSVASAQVLPKSSPAAGPQRPKLVVTVVIDQLRWSDLYRLAPQLSGGLKRLLATGAVFTGHYGHQNTYTGPGHALVLSGSYGSVNGIIQNKWFNRATGRSEGMMYDPDAKYLAGETSAGDDTSPRNFIGSTVGDELKLATGGAAKTVAVALKERGALLLGGRTGTAWFFAEATGEMMSSTYYMKELPAWVRDWNGKRLADQAFGKTWERQKPVGAYVLAGPDDSPYEANLLGLGKTFPHKVTGGEAKPGPKYWEAFTMTPFGIDFQMQFARAAVENEKLGQRGVTDLLAMSVSSTDLIGHTYGVYSHETEDALYATDKALGQFFDWLDGKLGKGGYWVVLTADHGAAQPPEQAAALGLAGVRTKKASIKKAVTDALVAKYGAGEWVVALEDPSIYLNWKLIDEKKLDRAAVEETAGEGLMTLPGFAGYVTRTQLLRGWLPPTPQARAIARSFHPARAGDVIAVQAPFSYWGKYGEKEVGGSHGSFYRYDTDVPLVFAGAPFAQGYKGQAEMVDLAATLSALLGVAAPAGCEGEPLLRALR